MSSNPTSLQNGLRRLCLYHTLRHSQELIEKAAKDNLSHQEFLEILIEEEIAFRHERAVARLESTLEQSPS